MTEAGVSTRTTAASEEHDLRLALESCQLIRRDLRSCEALTESARSLGTWAAVLFVVTVPLMMWKLHKARRRSARVQRCQLLLDQQLDLLRDRHGLAVQSRRGANPLAEVERDLTALLEKYHGELTRLRRIASVLRERLAGIRGMRSPEE